MLRGGRIWIHDLNKILIMSFDIVDGKQQADTDSAIIVKIDWLDISLLKIKVLNWHQWFHEEPLTSIEPLNVLYCGNYKVGLSNLTKYEKSGYFKKCKLKGYLGSPTRLFYGIDAQTQFWKQDCFSWNCNQWPLCIFRIAAYKIQN